MAHEPDHYRALGVSPDASQPEIRRAYRRLAREHHPDRHPADGSERFRALADAYAILGDPGRRADYDRSVHAVARRAPARGVPAVPARHGVLELSVREARLAATRPLSLTASGFRIVLPAGLTDGDQITLLAPDKHLAVLTVRVNVAQKT